MRMVASISRGSSATCCAAPPQQISVPNAGLIRRSSTSSHPLSPSPLPLPLETQVARRCFRAAQAANHLAPPCTAPHEDAWQASLRLPLDHLRCMSCPAPLHARDHNEHKWLSLPRAVGAVSGQSRAENADSAELVPSEGLHRWPATRLGITPRRGTTTQCQGTAPRSVLSQACVL